MKRYVVAIEGCPMADGRFIDHQALSSLETQRRGVPVRLGDNGDYVGWATNFERDGDGHISFEIEWDARGFEMNCMGMFKHIAVGQCLWDVADGVHFLASGVIYSIFVNDSPTPWDILNNSDKNRS